MCIQDYRKSTKHEARDELLRALLFWQASDTRSGHNHDKKRCKTVHYRWTE